MKTTVFVAFLLTHAALFSQVVGGRGNSDMTPTVAEPAKISSGGFAGDVNLFSGSYGASIPLGSVSTPGGLGFALSFNYNSSFTVGATPPIATGIPYGEGWNLNVPTVSVETEAFNNFTYQQYCDENSNGNTNKADFRASGIEPGKEGDLYWYSPYIDIPGVANGRAVFKYIDVDDSKTAVFVLNSFESQVELRYNQQGWTVIAADGTMYHFRVVMQSYAAPANRRVLYYDQTGLSSNNVAQTVLTDDYGSSGEHKEKVANSIEPKVSYNLWYCDQITHRNIPMQSINFIYKKYGAFNYFQEFNQSAYKYASLTKFASTTYADSMDFTVYTDVLLQSIEATTVNSLVQKLKLNYATDKAILNGNSTELISFHNPNIDAGRLDSLYSYRLVYEAGTDGNFSTDWKRYQHIKDNATTFSETPGSANPYVAAGGYVRSSVSSSSEIPFDHSFIESPRLGTSTDLIPGDIYEIRTKINRSGGATDLKMGNGTLDISVVTGNLNNDAGTNSNTYSGLNNNNSGGIYYLTSDYDATRGIPLFSTFNMAMKWTMSYEEGSKNTSNFFVMPNVPTKFGGFNVQIGPGNSDVDLSATPGTNSNLVASNIPNASAAYAFKTANYPLKSAANLPGCFGVGLPWGMMVPIYKSMISVNDPLSGSSGNPNDAFKFWWNKPATGFTYKNEPTKLDSTVTLDQFELIRYSKNPYMLVSVEHYTVNGEVGDQVSDGLKLTGKKTFEYTYSREQILENYAYASSATLQYKSGISQVHILLKAVRDIPVITTTDTTKYLTTFLEYSDYVSSATTYNTTQPLNGYTGKLLTRFVDHLGGITQIEYYPVSDSRTYYNNRFVKDQHCDAVVTTPAYGLSKAVTVHPVVKYILKNDEQDLVKNGTASSNNSHKRWQYDFDASTRVHKQTQLNDTNSHFYNGHKWSYDIGFGKVSVYGPTLTQGANSYVNKTVYEHHGYKLTSGSGSPTIEDYLYHGKLKSIKQYDVNNKLFEEKLINYAYTLAFKHGYTRPNLMRDDIIWDQENDNPGGTYEYEDYYLNQTLSVTNGLGTFTGTNAYPHLSIPVFNGTGEARELPRFLDFYYYPSLVGSNSTSEYFLHSYFVKKTEDITRTYDDYLYKQAVVSGTTVPVVVSPAGNPFGNGHTNTVSYLRSRDSVYFVQINTGVPKDVTEALIAASPLSDTVLYKAIISSNLGSSHKVQLLGAQFGLTDLTWKRIINEYSRFQANDLTGLVKTQAYFTDGVLEHLSQAITSSWDQTLVQAFFMQNTYLSYPSLLDFTDSGVDYMSAATFKAVLSKQPQMPEDILLAIVSSDYLAPEHLSTIFQYQVITDDVYYAIIADAHITNTTIDEIIESGMSYPSDDVLFALLERTDPVPDQSDWERIVTVADRELDESITSQLTTMFPESEILQTISFTGNPLAKYCNGAVTTAWDYIETKTTYDYYEADYRGTSNGDAYKTLMGLSDIPGRTINVSSFFGSGGTKTINNLYLKHEPSWQLFRSTTTSVHLPTAKQEEQYFYLYDLRNRYDRYWYNYDLKTVGSELTAFTPLIIAGDTLAYTADWAAEYGSSYEEDIPEIPKYDGMTKSRQYNMRSTPFQKTTITKSQRDDTAMERSEYYFYDARWAYNLDWSPSVVGYDGPGCESEEEPEPDPTGCDACMYWKYGTQEELLQALPYNYCLWEDPVIGFYACPYGTNLAGCHEGATLIDCNPTLGEDNVPEPERYLPPNAALEKTLQLRSTVVQMDTVMGVLNSEFTSKRFDRSNRYVADFFIEYDGDDEYGFPRPYRMFYPYDTLTTAKILERNEHMQPALIKDVAGIKTRFYYKEANRYWNVDTNCVNPNFSYLYNYMSVDAENIGLPIRVTVGYTRADSLSSTFEYTDAGQVKKVTNPSGHYFDYTFDGFHRLTSVTENGSRLLSRNGYYQWNHDGTKTFDQRTDQNYVLSLLYSNYVSGTDTNQRELQKAFLDPLGRTAGVAKAYKNNAEIKIYSGSVTYDNWGRAVETRKPFYEVDTNPFNYRTNLTATLKNTVKYDNDPAGLAVRNANYGIDVNGAHTVRTSTVIVNYIYASCELELNNEELQLIMKSGSTSGFRFKRTSMIDQDDKETVTYTNAFGQTVATIGWSDLTSKVITLFVYDNYGNVSKTINPKRQHTDYLYNMQGQLVMETSVDGGTKRYMYNKRGQISGIQDQIDHDLKNGSNVRTPRYRKLTYDDYGKPTGQYQITSSYRLDAFCYATTSLGQIGNYYVDAQGQSHYFRYTFTNRMTQDWLNDYTTLDPVNTVIMTTSGLPSGTSVPQKTTLYGTNPAVPSTLAKVVETKSYDLGGTAVQKINFTYDAQERIATQEIREHPTNEATNDSKLVKAKITYQSYNYRGAVTEERLDMGNDGSTEMQYFYSYDELNRLTQVAAAQGVVSSGSATKLASYGYDDARGTVSTTVYNVDDSSGTNKEVQVISYQYDDRDRLKMINSNLFGYELFYDNNGTQGYNNTNVTYSHNFNGNVNAAVAIYNPGVTFFGENTTYGYKYDGLNRLTDADAAVGDYIQAHLDNGSNTSPSDALYIGDETMTYDKIGNILTMRRVKSGAASNLGKTYDDFIYSYTSGTNKLAMVDGQNGTSDRNYTYDVNGNLLTDNFRGISATTYGRSSYAYNLTKGSDAISYLYDAADSRFYKKVVATAQTTEEMYVKDALGHDLAIVKFTTTGGSTTTDYEYFVFGNDRIARVTSSGTGNTPSRIYPDEAIFFLYDHLGNNRVSFTNTGTTTLTQSTVYAADYYPYGKILREYDNGNGDRYLTTMHERDKETGLDYRGARYYDCDVARFLSLDPLAGKFPSWSSYNYVMGNPVSLVDQDGKEPEPKGKVYVYKVWYDDNGKKHKSTRPVETYTIPGLDKDIRRYDYKNSDNEVYKQRFQDIGSGAYISYDGQSATNKNVLDFFTPKHEATKELIAKKVEEGEKKIDEALDRTSRAMTGPDAISLSAGYSVVPGAGGGQSYGVVLLTRGPDAGFHFYTSASLKVGYLAEFGGAVGLSSYNGHSRDMTIKTLMGDSYDYGGRYMVGGGTVSVSKKEDGNVGWYGYALNFGPSHGTAVGKTTSWEIK